MPDLAIVNGQMMDLAEASVSVLDLGFLRGIGAFETLRTYAGGHPHALDLHLERLEQAARELGINYPLAADQVRQQLKQAHQRSGYQDLRVNLIVTPGPHSHGVFGGGPATCVFIIREHHDPPPEWYSDGVAAITFAGQRVCPELKTTAYITGRPGLLAAQASGAHEAFYVEPNGELSEGVTSNILLRRGRQVLTPKAPSLSGITRRGLEHVCKAHDLELQTSPLTPADCYQADEVWICSAIRELVPVVQVDQHQIGDGRPGTWAARLRQGYQELATAEAVAGSQHLDKAPE